MTFSNDSTPPSARPGEEDTYPQLIERMQQHFTAATNRPDTKVSLFTTQVPDLFQVFLDNLAPDLRQQCTCATCQKFVNRYGSLVTIDAKGTATPALWTTKEISAPYAAAMNAIAAIISKAPISGVFLTEDKVWGKPLAGGWQHFSVTASDTLLFKPSPVISTPQVIAEKTQHYQLLCSGLEEFPLELAQKACKLLTTGSLYRSEKCIEIAQWFVELHQARKAAKSHRAQQNITWLAVATAPPGFCHIKNTMIGTLLADLKKDLAFAEIKSRFDAKMHPLKYQREIALPKAGNVARAEKIFDQLKTAGALERRFAKIEDVQALWQPTPPPAKKQGLFSHLQTSASPSVTNTDIPPIVMTWDKFSKTVLPTATAIEYYIPASKESYAALVTAKNPAAPPILQWDFDANRNPTTTYFYAGGSAPARWNLTPNRYHPVTAVVLRPSMWDDTKNFSHQGKTVFFILKGAKDVNYAKGGGFFTSMLKHEYYEVRATLEAYANSAVIAGKDEAEVCGIGFSAGNTWNHRFQVTSPDNLKVTYQLDRWD